MLPISRYLYQTIPFSRKARKITGILLIGIISLIFAFFFPFNVYFSYLATLFQTVLTLFALMFILIGLVEVYKPSAFERFISYLRHKFPREYEVYLSTSGLLERIEYEQRYKSSVSIETGLLMSMKGAFGYEKEITHRTYTLPELVDNYRSFVAFLTERRSKDKGCPPFDKIIIAIDELDKISDKEQFLSMLRKLKAILSIPNCYYLISLAEDFAKNFDMRDLGRLRDEMESSFDLIIKIAPVSLGVMKRIIEKRYQLNSLDRKILWLACLTSGGIPREALRNIQKWNLAGLINKGSRNKWKEAMKMTINEKLSAVISEILLSDIDGSLKLELTETLNTLTKNGSFTLNDINGIRVFCRKIKKGSENIKDAKLYQTIEELKTQLKFFKVIERTFQSKNIQRSVIEKLYDISVILSENRLKLN